MLFLQNRWFVLLSVLLAFLPIIIDMTILHIAVPSVTLALSASGNKVLWIIDIYPLIMAGLLVPMGTLSDRIGHRPMLLAGLFIFMLASLAAAFSPTANILITARGLLAVGGSMVMPNVLAIIRHLFDDPKERGIALGLWGTMGSAGAALGPLSGGALLEHFWWGSVFLINVPVILVVLPLAYLSLPRHTPTVKSSWAMGQALVLIAGLIAVVYAVKSGFKVERSPLTTCLMLAAGLGLLTGFVCKQLSSADPMLDLSLFSEPAICIGILMALVACAALTGVELTLAQELQFVVGYSPLQAGLFMVPLAVGSALGGPVAGYATALCGLRSVAATSLLAAAACLAGLSVSDFHHPNIMVITLLMVLGISLSIGLTASSIAIMNSAPPDKAGAAGSLEVTGYELGAGLGITFFGVLLSTAYSKTIILPADLPVSLHSRAASSISDTMVVAEHLGATGIALTEAGRAAFSRSHDIVLLAATSMIALLAVAVFVALRNYRKPAQE
ncbi:MFS transporter [Candidatus Sodalis endolongispinus]|uniref:MFS transporter n=1 Tax=Candidatus Sodalis endolongispinus TaxID=2812662 RepID=A0ABS5YFK0_9GAMM|nr:MFS transporter [Candidatus Sodalis endolongispinus]MBT9433427.1 MFS transporter [Candidatus Sodalis endolongispinus]